MTGVRTVVSTEWGKVADHGSGDPGRDLYWQGRVDQADEAGALIDTNGRILRTTPAFDALLIAAPINHLYTAENTRIWSAEKLLARYVGDLARSFELYSSRTPSRRYLNIKILGIFSDSNCTVDLCPGRKKK